MHERVTPADIAAVVSKSTGIPISNLLRGERKRLLEMESTLRKRVVGQEYALQSVSQAIRVGRAGLSGSKRPVASFMFLGPTGVGKVKIIGDLFDLSGVSNEQNFFH